MKDFFSKVWTWILNHKIIAIVVASVLVVGTTCAIVLPIALHEHSYATEWSSDAENHWHDATCKHEEEKSDLAAHTYANACDTTCDVCGYTRTVGAHVYDNACDTTCNVCGATREITHAHSTTLTADETTHYYLCSVCGDKKDEAAHVFDKTVASSEYLKAEATATTKAQYWKSCVCGAKSATEYFESDKTTATLTNIQDLSKTYDKVELANPTYETNSDGAVTIEWYQGDTKLDAKPVNAGTYKVKVIIAESATYTGISAEKEFTIAKKVLSGLSVDLTYDGTNSFEVPLGAANGILADDVADGIKVCITFANKNVGAAVTGAGLDADDGDNYTNYTIDFSKCSASIIPRVIDNLTYAFEYNGMEYRQAIISKNEHSDIVGTDQITLGVCFATPDVGATLDTSEETGYEPGFVEENYVLGENYNFSIIKKVVTELPATLTAEYKSIDGLLEGLEAPVEIDGIEATLIFVAKKSDNNNLYDPDEYTNATITQASLGDNFDLQIDAAAKYTITVAPKKLSALDIKITEAQYNKGEFTLVVSKDGVYAPVNVTFSKANYQDVMVDAVFELVLDEDHFMQGREVIAFADSGYATAYQFVPDANGIVGTITIVANCDVQYDGSCNCGTSHLTETLAFTGGEDVGKSATIACDSTYEGGIYKITLEGGEYEFFGTDQFFNISGIYDSNGNKLASSIGTYVLPQGTYYFHVYVGSSPSSDTIWVKKTAEYCSFETARVFECQTDENDSFTLSAEDKLYLKIMGGENSKLNDFEIDGEATFTLAVYGLDDTTEPSYVEATALSDYYWDVCNTSDFYVILTCVTAGDINISAVK